METGTFSVITIRYMFLFLCFAGSPTAVKEVSKPEISSATGRQVSAAHEATTDVTGRQLDNDAEESSDADGWDDAWDDEERWGDMEVREPVSAYAFSVLMLLVGRQEDHLTCKKTE